MNQTTLLEKTIMTNGNQCLYDGIAKQNAPVVRLLEEMMQKCRKSSDLIPVVQKCREFFEFRRWEIILQEGGSDRCRHFFVYDLVAGEEVITSNKKNGETGFFSLPGEMVFPGTPVLYHLKKGNPGSDAEQYIAGRIAGGCSTSLVLNLDNHFDVRGWIIADFTKADMAKRMVETMGRFTFQFANMLSYIIEHERKIEAERQKIILEAISEAIGLANSRNKLMKVINLQLKALLSFEAGVVGIINKKERSYCTLVTDIEPGFENASALNQCYSIDDPVMRRIMEAKEPIVFNIAELMNEEDKPDYIKLSYGSGAVWLSATPLKDQNGILGFISLLYNTSEQITDEKFCILRSLRPLLSTAISNIILKEEMDRVRFHKSLLAGLRRDLALINNKAELLQVVNSRLRKLVNFKYNAIGILSENGKIDQEFLLEPELDVLKSTGYNQEIPVENAVMDEVYSRAVKTGHPIVVDLEKLITKAPPLWIKMNYEAGAREMVIAILQKGAADKYSFVLFSGPKNNFDHEALEIIEHVTCDLAIVVAKIRINEEIQEEEKEKSILLDLSHGMATVKSKGDLIHIIKRKVARYFNAATFAISIMSEDRQSHSILIRDDQSGDMVDYRFGVADKENYIIDDDIFDRIVLSQEPLTFSLSRLKKMAKIPRYIFLYDDKKSDKLIGVRLKAGDTVIGCLWLHASVNVSMVLLKGICAQISVAVFNIISNEKIATQSETINSYKNQLKKEISYVQEKKLDNGVGYEMVGSSKAIKNVYELINQVAYSNSTVLITGETGTGKELAARAIHAASPRKDNPMIKVNCAAIPANLIESELFGHERGSFTGAVERRIGKFEMANNGTLFLDEIGEMPFELQAKLLRTLQEREIERLGGKRTIKIDVRIIVATNRELEKEVENGRFRPDLYYRLNVFPIVLPSLRDRKEDIRGLAAYFLERYAQSFGKRLAGMSTKVEQDLLGYHWPGNVRELEHIIERSTLMATSGILEEVHLPKNNSQEKLPDETFSFKTIKENERDHVLQTLRWCGGKISGTKGAAKLLDVPVSTLGSKIAKLNITKEEIFQIRI